MPFGNFRCLSYLEFPSLFRENNCGRVEKTNILNLEKNDLQRSGPNIRGELRFAIWVLDFGFLRQKSEIK